jgi:hypothetical protein
VFYSKLTPDTVQWNKNVATITFSDAENLITCSDGSVYACQLLIACDGIHSKITKTVLALSPNCSASNHNNKNSNANNDTASTPHIGRHLTDFRLMNIYGRANLTRLSKEDFEFFSHSEVQVSSFFSFFMLAVLYFFL